MANLPAIRWDTGPRSNAANLMLRGAENTAQADGALGQNIGGGLLQIGAGIGRKKERAEARQERESVRAEDAMRWETGRADHANEMALRMEHDNLVASESRLDRMIEEEGLDARFTESLVRAQTDPNVMADPEFAAEFGATRARLQKIMEGKASLQAQRQALIEQARQPAQVERRGKG